METHQLIVALAVASLLATSCRRGNEPPPLTPVTLAERCEVGPHCITGQIDDQFAEPVPDVRCVVRGERGEVLEARSNGRGVFLLDGLATLPRTIAFEKPGFAPETRQVLPALAGEPARLFVTIKRLAEGECTCGRAALVAGVRPCPDEQCEGTGYGAPF